MCLWPCVDPRMLSCASASPDTTEPDDKFKDFRLHSPVFWKLAKGHGRLRALLPDLPATLAGVEEIKRHRRRATAQLLGAPPRPWRPLSTDLQGLMSVYPVAWGCTTVTSGHNIPAWRRAHAINCDTCTATAPDHRCYHAHLINMLEFGWKPAWKHTPDKFKPRLKSRSAVSAAHQATLDDTIKSGLERKIISECQTVPKASCRTFVVDKRKFSARAMVWDSSWGSPPPLYRDSIKHRTVYDFSEPCPVNDAAVRWPVRYPSLSYYLSELSPTSWIATEDLAHSYQQLPLADDESRDRLSFCQRDPTTGKPAYYRHHTAPWGFAPSGSAFMCIPAALKPILAERGCIVDFYCDDTLLHGQTEQECQRQVEIFRRTCEELGIELNAKAQPPRRVQRFLGFNVDLPNQRVTLAPERLLQIRNLATECLEGPWCSRKQLKRLAGLVCWASSAIAGSRARTVSLFAAGSRRHLGKIKTTKLMREDLAWWRDLAAQPERNGTRIFLQPEDVAWATIISDAGGWGLGAHTASTFAWRLMTEEEQGFASQARELLAVELAISHLGTDFNNRVVVIGVDNVGTCSAINSGRAGNPDGDSIAIVRRIGDMCFERNIDLLALWTRRSATCLADAIADCTSLDDARACFERAMSTHSSAFDAATDTTRGPGGSSSQHQALRAGNQHQEELRIGRPTVPALVPEAGSASVASDNGEHHLVAHRGPLGPQERQVDQARRTQPPRAMRHRRHGVLGKRRRGTGVQGAHQRPSSSGDAADTATTSGHSRRPARFRRDRRHGQPKRHATVADAVGGTQRSAPSQRTLRQRTQAGTHPRRRERRVAHRRVQVQD